MRLILLLIILLIPSIALATESGEAVANLLNNVVYPILGPFLLGLATLLLNKIRQKWNLQISAGTEALLLDQAKNAIRYAEEKATAKIKDSSLGGVTGSAKLNTAINQLMLSSPKISEERADTLVHAALGMISGVGATADKALK